MNGPEREQTTPLSIPPAVVESMREGIGLLTTMMIGYRESLINGGIPQAVADQMVVQFHQKMLDQMK